ncbi:MAG: aromatic ring-hydroxylating dioxygenase subunit alpha [Aphanocapsa lilacina HA4352-LM1]|nr:aromatic ring-hydroxylating dioxygenase subunit alpha [Aphanocapsa lilacina HA4352-LM1]
MCCERCGFCLTLKGSCAVLNNFWYGLAHSPAITSIPRQVVVMGRPLVLYRTSGGRVVALEDRCAHRDTALSGGWVEGNCLRCPYHGWRYAPDGGCTEIPANQPGVAISRLAKVETFPVQERHGLVWVFLGELPAAQRPELPPLPEYADPGWRAVRGEFTWSGHYTRVIANTVDMSHAPFVHAAAFGRKEAPRIQTYHIESERWRGSASIQFKTKPAYFLKLVLGKTPPDGSITSTFHLPNVTQVHHRFGRIQFILFLVHVPVDDRTTHTCWLHLRNFVTHAWADPFMHRDVVRTFRQDDSVVRLQPPGPVPEQLNAEVHAPSDGLEVAYRRLRRLCGRLEWASPTQNPRITEGASP